MKNHLLYIFFAILLIYSGAVQAQTTDDRLIVCDLNQNGRPDTLFLGQPQEHDITNTPNGFEIIRITLDNGTEKTFHALDSWAKTDSCFSAHHTNAVASDWVFVHPETACTWVILFGQPFGTGQELCVIGIGNEQISCVLQEDLQLETIQLKDFDNDGHTELLLRQWPELFRERDDIRADIGTYSPFLIYKFKNPAVVDPELTQAYNEKHYVWAGLNPAAEVEVVYPRGDGRPYLLGK